MTPLDLGLAAAGRLAAAIDGRSGGRRRLTWDVVTGLVLMSLIPVLFIGSSPRPTDLTFEDVRLERIPAMTSWVRLEGDLRVREGGIGESLRVARPQERRPLRVDPQRRIAPTGTASS